MDQMNKRDDVLRAVAVAERAQVVRGAAQCLQATVLRVLDRPTHLAPAKATPQLRPCDIARLGIVR